MDPLRALTSWVRTPDDLSVVVGSLITKPVDDPGVIESLIMEMIRLGYPDNDIEKVVSWYGTCRYGASALQRSDSELMRAFRFLLDIPIKDFGNIAIKTTRLPLCQWGEAVINDMVRKHPYLYWCHKWYQDYITGTLDSFLKRDHSKPYSDRDWQAVEWCIRRVVRVRDWSLLRQVQTIYQFHQEGKMAINEDEDEGKGGKDCFKLELTKTILETAVRVLAQQMNKDLASNAQAFGTILGPLGNFDREVSVEVAYPNEIRIPKKDLRPSRFSVRISAKNMADTARLLAMLSHVELRLEIDGGYFPAIDGKNGRVVGLNRSIKEIGLYDFYFIPFEGRGRLTLTLSYHDPDHPENRFSTQARYFFEAKAVDTEV